MDVTLFIVSWLLLPALPLQTGCDWGWFGSKCQFMCHCTNVGCDNKGFCKTGERCLKRWFGPACQYEDIAYLGSNLTEATDEDDETCVDYLTVKRVFVSLNSPLTWVRVHLEIPGVLNTLRVNMWGHKNAKMCTVPRHVSVDNRTLDINCVRTSFVYSLVFYGLGASFICSVYVTGGRNVALKQNVRLSSTYVERSTRTGNRDWIFPAELAVDGDRNQNLYQGKRCAMTRNDNRNKGTLSLLLSPPCVVNKFFVYNRVDAASQKLKFFTLESFNASGSSVYRRKDEKPYFTSVYEIQSGDLFVARVVITTSSTDNVLHVCELEVYGEYICPTGRYGLECEKTCNCMIQDSCFVSTGGCPSGCASGYYGWDCSTPCATERFGPNCRSSCSPFCVKSINDSETSCDRFNGICLSGCEIGYEGSNCDVPCGINTYGIFCQLACSEYCLTSNDSSVSPCHHISGACTSGCTRGYTGEYCLDICDPDTHGINCQLPCNQHCLPSNDSSDPSCDHISGVCIYGCTRGYTGEFCMETCDLNTYGNNCQMNCSSECLAGHNSSSSPCDHVSGVCVNGCADGYIGELCDTRSHQGSNVLGSLKDNIIFVVSTIFIVAILIAIIAVLFCVKKEEDMGLEENSE